MEFELSYEDESVEVIKLNTFSEIYLIDDSAKFETIESEGKITGFFKWFPNNSHSREYPYIIIFTGISKPKWDKAIEYDHNVTLAVYVNEPVATSDNIIKLHEINDGVVVYPNPSNQLTTVKLEYDLSIYKNLNFKVYDISGRNVYSRNKL